MAIVLVDLIVIGGWFLIVGAATEKPCLTMLSFVSMLQCDAKRVQIEKASNRGGFSLWQTGAGQFEADKQMLTIALLAEVCGTNLSLIRSKFLAPCLAPIYRLTHQH